MTKEIYPNENSEVINKLSQYGIIEKETDNILQITNLGGLSFGVNLKEFQNLKRKTIRVVHYDGNTRSKRIIEEEFKKGYAAAFEDLIKYVNSRLPSNEIINEALRQEKKMYPEVAIREFIANALIHQDFIISGSRVMIEIFTDRLEITNPGIPLIDINRFIDHPPRSRNEDFASLMRLIGICEEGGTGVDRALIQIELYQLPAPKFEIYGNNSTRVTMFAYKTFQNMTVEDKIRACYQHAVLQYVKNEKMTNESLRNRLGIPKSNYPAASDIFRKAIKQKLIKESSSKSKEYVPIWA